MTWQLLFVSYLDEVRDVFETSHLDTSAISHSRDLLIYLAPNEILNIIVVENGNHSWSRSSGRDSRTDRNKISYDYEPPGGCLGLLTTVHDEINEADVRRLIYNLFVIDIGLTKSRRCPSHNRSSDKSIRTNSRDSFNAVKIRNLI